MIASEGTAAGCFAEIIMPVSKRTSHEYGEEKAAWCSSPMG
jgi:hypothetical protein